VRKTIFLLALFLFTWVNFSFALDWIKLHEEADKESVDQAKSKSLAKPDSVDNLYVLGLVYLNVHKDKEAIEVFEKILALKPDTFEAQWGQAEVLRRQHELKASKKILNEVLRAHPDFSPAYITLAYVKYIEMDFNGSVRLANKVIDRGKKGSDLSNYVRAILLYGGAKGVIAHYGGLLSKLINGMAVFSNLKKAENLQPDSAAVKYGLGSFYLLAPGFVGGDLKLAEEYLAKAVELDPLFPNAYVRLGEVYKVKGDKQGYGSYLKKALEIDPQNEIAISVRDGTCKYVCAEPRD